MFAGTIVICLCALERSALVLSLIRVYIGPGLLDAVDAVGAVGAVDARYTIQYINISRTVCVCHTRAMQKMWGCRFSPLTESLQWFSIFRCTDSWVHLQFS